MLKKLAGADPTNPLWPADLETYETTRLNQIKQELNNARRDHDLETIQQLAAEIQNNTWVVEVPSALKKDVEAYAQDFGRSKAEAELIQVTEQLNQAWAAFDREVGVQLARQWRSLNETARTSPGNETFDGHMLKPTFALVQLTLM